MQHRLIVPVFREDASQIDIGCGRVAQRSCPKCLVLIPSDAIRCPECGATEASLRREATSASLHQVPSSKSSIFRWKRESLELLVMLAVGLALLIAIRWLVWTLLGGSWNSGWTLPF